MGTFPEGMPELLKQHLHWLSSPAAKGIGTMSKTETPGAPDPRLLLTVANAAARLLENTDEEEMTVDHGDWVNLCEALDTLESTGWQAGIIPTGAAAEARAEPVWSREVPTVEGMYWRSTAAYSIPYLCSVPAWGIRNSEFARLYPGGWWLGPITPRCHPPLSPTNAREPGEEE